MGEWGTWVMVGVLGLLIVLMVVMQIRRRRQMTQQQDQMIDRLRAGMRIKTVAGAIGRIVEIRDEGAGLRTVLIETGNDRNKSFLLYDVQAILSIVDDPMSPPTIVENNTPTTPSTQTPTSQAQASQGETWEEMKARADGQGDFDAKEFVDASNKSRKRTTKTKS